jgi:activating signal cointegrator 1
MRAITICQPYPRLILIGEKPVENRTWYTDYRGPLAIHAGKSRAWLDDDDEQQALDAGDPLVFGAVVGVCTLADCLRVATIEKGRFDSLYPQLKSRAHCHGPWCWVLTEVKQLTKPVPYKGQQGFFNIPDELIKEAI